ncbi:hypothetical protein KAW44_00110, partial [Candidatus Bipolaricaulota bacterium]|nr:hypothetical protein [Candidatus Bipolaricaulota bacterium]
HLKLTLWPADLIIHPNLPRGLTYLRAAEGIHAGEQAMKESLPKLRALLIERRKALSQDGNGRSA